MIPTIATTVREQISAVFYDGRVVPAHTDSEHYYKDVEDGEVYASVTTKTSLLSRKYYKQLAADKAVDYIQEKMPFFSSMEPEGIAQVFKDARDMHITDLNQAGTWGTHGHDLVDSYISLWIKNGERPAFSIKALAPADITPQGVCVGLSAEKFFNDYDLFPIVSEKKIISKKYKYGGTLDSLFYMGDVYKERVGDPACKHNWWEKNKKGDHLVCDTCGRDIKLVLSLLDWKSSNMIFGRGDMSKFDYAMQVAAYDGSLREMCHVKPKRHWIVRLDKAKPFYEVGVIQDIKQAYKCFLGINMIASFAKGKDDPILPLLSKTVITL